jgi:hypothetical protein
VRGFLTAKTDLSSHPFFYALQILTNFLTTFFSFSRYIKRRRFYSVSACFGSGYAWILVGWIQDPQRECGSGSRRAKMTHKNIQKVKQFRVLKC